MPVVGTIVKYRVPANLTDAAVRAQAAHVPTTLEVLPAIVVVDKSTKCDLTVFLRTGQTLLASDVLNSDLVP